MSVFSNCHTGRWSGQIGNLSAKKNRSFANWSNDLNQCKHEWKRLWSLRRLEEQESEKACWRPTTTMPIVVAHPHTNLTALGLPRPFPKTQSPGTGDNMGGRERWGSELQVVRIDTPLLRDVVLIDCPDPDTSESETAGSNLAKPHQLLPVCDVLLYVSTQQNIVPPA